MHRQFHGHPLGSAQSEAVNDMQHTTGLPHVGIPLLPSCSGTPRKFIEDTPLANQQTPSG